MIAALLAGVLACPALGQETVQATEAAKGAGTLAEPPRAADERLDKILSRLEERKITDLRAKVRWDVEEAVLQGAPLTKLGTLYYLDREPVAQFKVEFTEKVDGQRKDKLDEQHLFDGQWYVELNRATKSVTRREVRAPGDKRNPFKLGEGAFPLPFGQKKADIVREFEVTRIDKEEKGDPPDTDHIKLTPKPATSTYEQYRTIEFWIARESSKLSGLPVRVKAAKKDGTGRVNSYVTVTFTNVELNPGLGGGVFKIDKPADFSEQVEKLQAAPQQKPEEIKIEDMKPAE
jgi:hypothetical protein